MNQNFTELSSRKFGSWLALNRTPGQQVWFWFRADSPLNGDFMYYTYVLQSGRDKRFYIGSTENLERRLAEHSSGKCHTTLRFGELKLIFYECFLAKEDALRRERYFKTTKGKKALSLILRDSAS
jgi:putative endonuclease